MPAQQPIDHADKWIPRKEAAALCGVHFKTVKRWENDEEIIWREPEVPNGPVMVNVGSLIEAGHYRPTDPTEPVEMVLRRTDAERELDELRERYHRAEGMREQLQARLEDAQQHIKDLNGQLKAAQQQVNQLIGALAAGTGGGGR